MYGYFGWPGLTVAAWGRFVRYVNSRGGSVLYLYDGSGTYRIVLKDGAIISFNTNVAQQIMNGKMDDWLTIQSNEEQR